MKTAIYIIAIAIVGAAIYWYVWAKNNTTATVRTMGKRPGMAVQYIPPDVLLSGGLSGNGGLGSQMMGG